MSDRQARDTALNPNQSFIVQAPAGSGKTELLIQRYLTLLTSVQEPEQIIAITFTRKAAAEMRSRVLRALRAAASGEAAEHAHQAHTLDLARSVIARDQARQWSLQSQPQRMRIDTLDALNVWLAQQLPVLSGGVAGARIAEDASAQYRQAARRTLSELADTGPLGGRLRALIREFDNNLTALETLLAQMLPRRDQWIGYLVGSNPRQLRVELERALARLVFDELDALAGRWPRQLRGESTSLLRHAARFAESAATRRALEPWLELEQLPGGSLDALAAWQAAAEILLTRDGQWRRRLSKQQGFGPEHAAARERLQNLLEQLRGNELLREALVGVVSLPDPHYSDAQWDSLAALRIVLIHLAAELRVVFAEQQCVDFVELALAARQALGHVDNPSELLLALDQRIQHLLIDEFQDTSHSQLKLLELLTAGWQVGDGRSLFLVGDPMQSIYRFRDADLSLFLKAKQRGIGAVACTNLSLERNFRSSPAIVDWANRVFSCVFPAADQLATGTAGFQHCTATRNEHEHHCVQVHPLSTDDSQAELVRTVRILEQEIARAPQQALAVLVQSRSHLSGLHEHLRGTGWPVHAVEIDVLNEHQLGQDLIGLTRALTHLGDRIAWLGVLRAPWCGLVWADLHTLCHDAPRQTVWQLMHEQPRIERLTRDGQQRLAWTRAALAGAFARRRTQSLARWIEDTWLRLDGPAWLEEPEEHKLAEQFFSLLAGQERHGDLDDPARLEELFARAQPSAEPPRESGIEIMTIHRAKGLEFDTVVVLGLGREPRRDDSKALHWMERVSAQGSDDLILAPPAGRGGDRLTEFVRRAERQRDLAERARLLYVASTRARDRLHLVGHLQPARSEPPPASLLACLWPHVAVDFELAAREVHEATTEPEFLQPVLRRFATGYSSPSRPERCDDLLSPATATLLPEYQWVSRAAVHAGTVVHGHLQRIAEQGLDRWTPEKIRDNFAVFRRELRLLGVEPEDLAAATARVIDALSRVLEDPRGRWVLGHRAEARSELLLTLRSSAGLEHVRLDRTFVDQDIRWVIDFKTSEHEGGDAEAFLDSEVQRYRAQLARYAAVMAQIDGRPVRVGLYFPLLQAFRSWSPGPSAPQS